MNIFEQNKRTPICGQDKRGGGLNLAIKCMITDKKTIIFI